MTITNSTRGTTGTPMTETEGYIWCAGFFDACGRIQVSRPSKSDAMSIAIEINKPSESVLTYFQRRIGSGGVTAITIVNRPMYFRWQRTGQGAGVVLEQILPWLVMKQEQAMLGIELANTIDPTRKQIPPDVVARREEIRREILIARARAKES